jgi:hypothetical protein
MQSLIQSYADSVDRKITPEKRVKKTAEVYSLEQIGQVEKWQIF